MTYHYAVMVGPAVATRTKTYKYAQKAAERFNGKAKIIEQEFVINLFEDNSEEYKG